MQPRTSLSHPLRIDEVSCAPEAPGVIGVTFCPGKCGDSVFGSPWQRDLEIDTLAIQEWGAQVVLTLVEERELHMLNVPGLGASFARRGIPWLHMPIPDLCAPGDAFHSLWDSQGATALEVLGKGGKTLVHCRGGLGRAGTVACMLLMELGATSANALARVRRSRPGAVETKVQERYLAAYAARLQGSAVK